MKFKNSSAADARLREIFSWFHMHPELSYEEYETTARIRHLLEEAGIEILPYELETGLVAVIRGALPGPVQALRADIDALPVTEETQLEDCSLNPGRMHACGHDFHITAGLGTAFLLQENRDALRGTVKLLFQPAEESALGALKILETGTMEDVDRTWGFHVSPTFETGMLGASAGSVAASVDKFLIKIKGLGCHGAKPQDGIDPIPAACALVQALQTIVTRNVTAFHPVVLSVTRIEAGKTWNVIPSGAELEGTLRTLNREDRALVERRLREAASQTAAAYGCEAEVIWTPGSPAVCNDEEMAGFAARVGKDLGWQLVPEGEAMSGDDFSFYQDYGPACYVRIGTGLGAALHQPRFQVDRGMLLPAAEYLAELLCRAAEQM